MHPLLYKNKDWIKIKHFLLEDFDADFAIISEDQRLLDVTAEMSRGNHKSAIKHHDALWTNFDKEVRAGFQFPISTSDVKKFPGSEVSPVGAASQDAIDELGQIIEKFRPTHNQSFGFSQGKLVNHRLEKDSLPPL